MPRAAQMSAMHLRATGWTATPKRRLGSTRTSFLGQNAECGLAAGYYFGKELWVDIALIDRISKRRRGSLVEIVVQIQDDNPIARWSIGVRREYDLLAICCLMLALILIAAMTTDPKGFSVRDWQPLMASLVALGGASIVYRGARLAYQAAMEKVNLDREQAERERISDRLSLFLRLTTSLYAVMGSIIGCTHLIDKRLSETISEGLSVTPRQIRVYNPKVLSEAWDKLHLFPSELITDIAVLQEMLSRLEEELDQQKDATWIIEFPCANGDTKTRRVPEFLATYSEQCKGLENSCTRVIHRLEEIMPQLRKFDDLAS